MLPSSSLTSSSSCSSSSPWMIPLAAAAVTGAAVTASIAIRRFKKQQRRQHDDDEIVTITLPSWATTTKTTTNTVDNNISSEPRSSSSSSSFDMKQYANHKFTSDDEMMAVAISLSDTNVKRNSGGPFGAAIFERHYDCDEKDEETCSSSSSSYCTLVSIGMNRVVPLNNSTCHGEMVAIQLAQKKMGSFTLNMMTTNNTTTIDDKVKGEKEKSNQQQQQQKEQRQFELFTSCEPCAMCLGATLWSGVSRIVCAATKDDAQAIGFDEGPVYESSYAHLESCGVQVTRGVMREEARQVLRRYAKTGLIYNR